MATWVFCSGREGTVTVCTCIQVIGIKVGCVSMLLSILLVPQTRVHTHLDKCLGGAHQTLCAGHQSKFDLWDWRGGPEVPCLDESGNGHQTRKLVYTVHCNVVRTNRALCHVTLT